MALKVDSLGSRSSFSPKRKIAALEITPEEVRARLARRSRYTGSPLHKRNPGDYCLTPPSSPRPRKTLCDGDRPILKEEAQNLLKEGFFKGMMSERWSGEWPEMVWAVSGNREVFEAQLENRDQGHYHGYPLQVNDDFRTTVLKEWDQRESCL